MTGLVARKIGEQFLVVLEQWLTPSEFADCCSAANDLTLAHDYCDANMAMDAAFQQVMGREVDFNGDADMDVINAAWDEAREILRENSLDDDERSNGPRR